MRVVMAGFRRAGCVSFFFFRFSEGHWKRRVAPFRAAKSRIDRKSIPRIGTGGLKRHASCLPCRDSFVWQQS